jgi:hypothetical protein
MPEDKYKEAVGFIVKRLINGTIVGTGILRV